MQVARAQAERRPWRELASLLDEIFTATGRDGRTEEPAIRDGDGAIPRPAASPHQKLVIFTEHRDTLRYLQERITTLLGRQTSVVVIHCSVGHEERLAAQEAFRHDPQVQVLLATDAAGEGINLQRGHLMVNYALPWNPNRLEQRFGRIHRIGQTEVCHLWNLIADETREGDVYRRLLEKLEQARQAGRPGLRRARQAGVRRAAAARAAARRHPLRRAAGGPRAARHCRRPGRSTGDRNQRASPPPLRTDRVREAAGRPARAAVGGFRLSGPSVARRRHRPDPGTPPRLAQARRGPRRRARPRNDAPRALLHRAPPCRTPASPVPAVGASSRRGCSMSSSTTPA